jgi:hypothetical protein
MKNRLIIGLVLAAPLAVAAFWLSRELPSTSTGNALPTSHSIPSTTTAEPTIAKGKHPLDLVLAMARHEAEAFERKVVDYTATLVKRERVNGTLADEQKFFIKVINAKKSDQTTPETTKPKGLHVYLRLEEPKKLAGREVIWVDGANDGNLIAHEAGWMNVTRVSLKPDGALAMMGNRYPITQIGMGKLFSKLIEKGERDRNLGDCQVTVRDEIYEELACQVIEVVHPEKKPGLDFHIARIYLDPSRHLPLRFESYLWPLKPNEEPSLEEQYSYQNVEVNVGLTEADFDPANKHYQFP